MRNIKELEWNVYRYDSNKKEIVMYNVFEHGTFHEDIKKWFKKKLSREEFSKELKSLIMYHYWCRAEHEVVITSWLPYISKEELDRLKLEDCKYRCYINLETGIKVDIYSQLTLNWERFIDYVYSFGE